MKVSSVGVLFVSFAGALAVPMTQRSPQENADGGNFVSGIFDTTACLVSSIIGGGNPKCHKPPAGTTISGPGKTTGSGVAPYTYTYTTNGDGTATYVINPTGSGSKCPHTVNVNDPDLTSKLDQFAKDCVGS